MLLKKWWFWVIMLLALGSVIALVMHIMDLRAIDKLAANTDNNTGGSIETLANGTEVQVNPNL